MDTDDATTQRIARRKQAMRKHIRELQFAEAEELCRQLLEEDGVDGETEDMLASRVAIDVFRGRLQDTMCMLNGLREDQGQGPKAACLRLLDDPYWEGMAMQAQAGSTDPDVQKAMKLLLDTADQW